MDDARAEVRDNVSRKLLSLLEIVKSRWGATAFVPWEEEGPAGVPWPKDEIENQGVRMVVHSLETISESQGVTVNTAAIAVFIRRLQFWKTAVDVTPVRITYPDMTVVNEDIHAALWEMQIIVMGVYWELVKAGH